MIILLIIIWIVLGTYIFCKATNKIADHISNLAGIILIFLGGPLIWLLSGGVTFGYFVIRVMNFFGCLSVVLEDMKDNGIEIK